MVILWIQGKKILSRFKLSSWPRERKLNLKLSIFQLKRTFRVSWKHILMCENTRIVNCAIKQSGKVPHKVLYLTNRFHVAVRLFSNRSQMTSKCGKNKKSGTRRAAECVTDVLTTLLNRRTATWNLFVLYNEKIKLVLCDLLLNRRTATWNLFVLYNKEIKNAPSALLSYIVSRKALTFGEQ